MTETMSSLRRKMAGARDLRSVVRTMKAMSASNVGRYEQAARALDDYAHTVEQGLRICMRGLPADDGLTGRAAARPAPEEMSGAVVFGSDQGLVGRFNELVAELAASTLHRGQTPPPIWAVGERVHDHLRSARLTLAGAFAVPTSIAGISTLVGQILTHSERLLGPGQAARLHLFHCRRDRDAPLAPVHVRLIPQGDEWLRELADRPWPGRSIPEVLGDRDAAFRSLIREHLFVSLYRACAESLASENASRLEAMQRAERNIDELQASLKRHFHQLRQSGIDEELFDVVSGFEALTDKHAADRAPDRPVHPAGIFTGGNSS